MDEVGESRPRAVEEPPRGFLGQTVRRRAARVIAVLVDALQIVVFPAFFPGIVSPFDNALDVLTGIVMTFLLGFHVAFGLLSLLAPGWLLDGTGLAASVSGFIALYWSARLVLQFTYLDRSDAPQGRWFLAAEAALVSLFVFLSVTYTGALVANLAR